jgi:hypothetical protein
VSRLPSDKAKVPTAEVTRTGKQLFSIDVILCGEIAIAAEDTDILEKMEIVVSRESVVAPTRQLTFNYDVNDQSSPSAPFRPMA